jgi:Sigma-70 region 2
MNPPIPPLPPSCAELFQRWLAQVLPHLYQSASRYRSFRAARSLDIDDLVQETCVRALRSAAAFRGSTLEELRLWLGGILRHCAADLLSRAHRIASAEAEVARRPARMVRRQRCVRLAYSSASNLALSHHPRKDISGDQSCRPVRTSFIWSYARRRNPNDSPWWGQTASAMAGLLSIRARMVQQ